ncbi:hypothetical protein D3C80_1266620 [compost metagenome]
MLEEVLPPSAVVAVTVTVPAAIPVTLPLALTEATAGLETDQLTALLVAFEGATLAAN